MVATVLQQLIEVSQKGACSMNEQLIVIAHTMHSWRLLFLAFSDNNIILAYYHGKFQSKTVLHLTSIALSIRKIILVVNKKIIP